jgi:branched-chain amino acid aminotransferase
MLYAASEVFFTGTACEVTPVREIDKISIGTGEPGPITRKLQAAFSAAAKDVPAAHPEWLAFL